MCILHCYMAMGRLLGNWVAAEALRLGHRSGHVELVQNELDSARVGFCIGAGVSTDGEESHRLFWAWEKLGPTLGYALTHPVSKAVVAMRSLLTSLYRSTPTSPPPDCAEVTATFRRELSLDGGSH